MSLINNERVSINVVGRCERNVWNGNVSPQILVEEYEVVNKMMYCFLRKVII